MRRVLLAALALLVPANGQAALRTQTIEYKHGDTALEGYLAYDDTSSGPRPGFLWQLHR